VSGNSQPVLGMNELDGFPSAEFPGNFLGDAVGEDVALFGGNFTGRNEKHFNFIGFNEVFCHVVAQK